MSRGFHGFFYVVIPPSPEEEIYQVYHPQRAVQYDDVSFIRKVREVLGEKAPQIDEYRKHLRKDLLDLDPSSQKGRSQSEQERQGLQDEDKVEEALQKIGDDQLEQLQSMLALKAVALSETSQSAGKKAVFLFHREHSNDPVNARATNLCWTAGLPPKELRGACILSRTEELVEEFCKHPVWCRCDFTIADCASNAPWLQEARQHRVQSGLKREDDVRWFENLTDCEDPLPRGVIEGAAWNQTKDEIDICFDPGPFVGIRATRRDVTVRYSKRTLFVRLRGRVLFNAELAGEVDPSGCCWTFDRDRFALQVTLCKSDAASWKELVRREVVQQDPEQAERGREQADQQASRPEPLRGSEGFARNPIVSRRCQREGRVIVLVLSLYYLCIVVAWIISKISSCQFLFSRRLQAV